MGLDAGCKCKEHSYVAAFRLKTGALERNGAHSIEAVAPKGYPRACANRGKIIIEIRRLVLDLREVKKGVGLGGDLLAKGQS